MFTDLHEEIAATFERLQGCLSFNSAGSLIVYSAERVKRDEDDYKRLWRAERARYLVDLEFCARRKEIQARYREKRNRTKPEVVKEYSKRLATSVKARKVSDPAWYAARLELSRKWKAAHPLTEADRRAKVEAQRARRVAKRLEAKAARDRDRVNRTLERSGKSNTR